MAYEFRNIAKYVSRSDYNYWTKLFTSLFQ